jgi:hypothetical protein
MAIATGEVVPDPEGARHYRVIIRFDGDIIATWNVRDEAEGRATLLEALQGLKKLGDGDL